MNCNIQFATTETAALAAMKTQGGIDIDQNIINKSKFDELNEQWSQDAYDKFGLKGKVFYNFDNKATPNDRMLAAMDEIKNDPQEYKKIYQSDAIKSLEGFTVFEGKDTLCSRGICNMTAQKSTEKLKEVGLNPYPNNGSGSSLTVSVPSPVGPFNIEHYVSAVIIENKVYIYDMPQHEFLTAPVFGQGDLDATPYTPRLIPLDVDSIQANYDITTAQAAKFIRGIINKESNNVILISFKDYIKQGVDNHIEYLNDLEQQISDEGVMIDQKADYALREQEFADNNAAKEQEADNEIKKITQDDENKIIRFFSNKLKEKIKQYLPRKADHFSLKTLIYHVTGIDFDYVPGKLEDTLHDLGLYLSSPVFVDKLKREYLWLKEQIKTSEADTDQAFHYKRLLESFFKQARVYGPVEAKKKFSPNQQYELNMLLDKSIVEGRAGNINAEGVQGKGRTAKQQLFLSEKYFSNINNVIKKANINFGNPIDKIYENKMKNNAKLGKIKTVLQYLESMEGNTAPLHAAISHEAQRRHEYFTAQGDVMYQMEDFAMSTASDVTIEKVKRVAEEMGINMTSLEAYAKSNPAIDVKNANGVADLTRKTIAIAEGRDNVALTEEVVHIATAIMEQTNPKLVTQMISKIGDYKIYQKTFDAYKGKKGYQLADGKPDIRKIKKEAVDKLLAEVMINGSENTDQFPELRQKNAVSMVQRWWEAIMEEISRRFGMSRIDIFQTAADQIMNSKAGSVNDISSQGVYLQVGNDFSKINEAFDKIVEEDEKLKLVGQDTEDRHYEHGSDTAGWVRVKQSVTEKVKRFLNMKERTPEQKREDDNKKNWGTKGHEYIEDYIKANLIDENGYVLKTTLEVPIATELEEEVELKIQEFCKLLVGKYPEGTRIGLEKKVINKKESGGIESGGGMASAIDFIAVVPKTNPKDPNGPKDFYVDILDWKFTSIDITQDDDIPWFKQRDWKKQMGEYTRILYQYGVKPHQIGKARMVPFIMNYAELTPEMKRMMGITDTTDGETTMYPASMEVGSLENLEDMEMYLLPVPIETESTGNVVIDTLLAALNQHHRFLSSKKAETAIDKEEKKKILNPLVKAIRKLQVTKDFTPLANVGQTYLKGLNTTLESFENIDWSELDKDVVQKRLGDLMIMKDSAEKFALMEEAFLSEYSREGLTVEQQKVLDDLSEVAAKAKEAIPKIDDIINEYAMQLAVDEGFLKEVDREQAIAPEREILAHSKTFLESSKLSNTMIRMGTRLVERSKSALDVVFIRKMKSYREDLAALEKETGGSNTFEKIGTSDPKKGLHIFDKIDPEFTKNIEDAINDSNKAYIIDNIDLVAYNKLANELIEKQSKIIKETQHDNDPGVNQTKIDIAIAATKKRYDINRKNFNGYKNGHVTRMINETLVVEGHYSKEYQNMSSAAKAVWQFYYDLNKEAKDMGYIGKDEMSFFPMVEATALQKFGATNDIKTEVRDFFKDLYTGRIDENKGYSRVDPKTGESRRSLPKYFTQTDRRTDQLSVDLNKIGTVWLKSTLEYENSKAIENTMLALYNVEKVKGRLVLDERNNLIPQGGGVASTTQSNKNLGIFETYIDDALYGLTEEQGGMVNKTITSIANKRDKDGDGLSTEISLKKGFENANTLVRVLGVGLKPAIAIANWFGFQFQAAVMSGANYRFAEFEKNNLKYTTGQLSQTERGLLEVFVPFNDDLATDQERRTGKKLGFLRRINAWSFTDVMMSTNHFPERALQGANALSFFQNGMVRNGKIVNIRQFVKAKDREKQAEIQDREQKMSLRRDQRRDFEDRVKVLQDSESLVKIAVVNDEGVTIPGVSEQTMGDYRLKIQDWSRNLNGQMSSDNKAGYRRNIMGRSFMMFKTWIPKLVSVRTLDLQYNVNQGDWEYGRANLWFGQVFKFGMSNMNRTRDILLGNENGMKIMDEILKNKKDAYFKKHNKELTITPEEFYDLVQREVANQMKELGMLIGLVGTVFAAKAAEPPEDATRLEQNRYKYYSKVLNKIQDEVSFYYDPRSFQSITKGSILPSLNLLVMVKKIFGNVYDEVKGEVTGDKKLQKKAKPLKYFLNIVPGFAQYQNSIQSILDKESAEASRQRGVITSGEARRN